MSGSVLRLGLDEYGRRAGLDGALALEGVSVVVVDCDAGYGRVDASAPLPTSWPAVLVATGALASGPDGGAFDVVAPDVAAVEQVVAAVDRAPLASTALALLLRGASHRTIDEGLVAESSTYSLLQAGPEHRAWLAARPVSRRGSDTRPTVAIERDADVLHVTLARPEVHNAYSAAMRDALIDALAVAHADPGVRVVIDGAGPSFCSGGDLTEFGTAPDPATAHVVRLLRSAARAIAAIADRVTVRVHGACAGAGVELPSFAGRVEARADARFWLPEVAMGLVPGAGGTVGITRRVGRQRAAWLALTGAPLDARAALEWGLVDAVVDGWP